MPGDETTEQVCPFCARPMTYVLKKKKDGVVQGGDEQQGDWHCLACESMELASADRKVMEEYFASWENRLSFLDQLADTKHPDEALTLACCYIDTLGGYLFPRLRRNSQRRFVKVLVEHSGNPVFAAIHPRQVAEFLGDLRSEKEWARNVEKDLSAHLRTLIGQLFTEAEFVSAVCPKLTPAMTEKLRQHLWRGTIAAILYEHVRCAAVHSAPPIAVTFDRSRLHGRGIEPLHYPLVGPAVRGILAYCVQRSFSTGKYYGHDYPDPFGRPRAAGQEEVR